MIKTTPSNSLRLMVIGEGKVGKSALVVKYLTGRFIWEYQSDYDWKYTYETIIDGNHVHMEIIDSLTMEKHHLSWAEGFMFVYDVTNPLSVSRIEWWKKTIDSVRDARPFAMVVVGNKADLEHSRKIKREKAQLITSRLSAACHVDSSACGPEINVRYAFDELCREVSQLRQQLNQKRERRRSSLSTVRQGIKNLVQSGKVRTNLSSGSESGSTSPVVSLNGRIGPGARRSNRLSPSSPFSSVISPPTLTDLPEESNRFSNFYSNEFDAKVRKSRDLFQDGCDDAFKRSQSYFNKNYRAVTS